MKYTEKDLVRIAQRENNTKRGYLVVDPLQGKHVPVAPSKAINLFEELAEKVKGKYEDETLLVVGFAETATAIGAHVAVALNTAYIQTTREVISDVEYLFFSEAHSHATEQKLVKDDIDRVINDTDRIIFVEDEVTTGNTIMNIINLLRATYSKSINYTILSLLNGMEEESVKRCEAENIDMYYLVKTDHSTFEEKAAVFNIDGRYVGVNGSQNENYGMVEATGYVNARRLTDGDTYKKACEMLAEELIRELQFGVHESVLVIGTEEFMYPALYVGNEIEKLGCNVRCHSTTRSPIGVSEDDAYPLHIRYELESVYDKNRKTYIYDIAKYDRVVVVTDAKLQEIDSIYSLLNAIQINNSKVEVVRWS